LGKSKKKRLLMDKSAKIYIAGHNGMVGSALHRNLKSKGFQNFVFSPYPQYDLTDQKTVYAFFKNEKPDYVIDAAAKVGGIVANNTYRAQFIYENLMIQNNIIHHAHIFGVKKFLFLGSSCIYPRNSIQPIREEYLLTGVLERTNEPYAIAKIAGIKMCENYFEQYGSNFISVMPTNLYGPGDNYNLETSHVIPALIRKFHEAKLAGSSSVEVWGSGSPRREFLYVEDMADACIFIMQNLDAAEIYSSGLTHLNIGVGTDCTIKELVTMMGQIVNFSGEIYFDTDKPDGTPQKLLDVSRLEKYGWKSKTELRNGLYKTYEWYKENIVGVK
jgi:GDP-L-fucose synthase